MSKEAPTRLVLDPNGDVVFRLQRMNTAGANSNAAEGTAVGSASSSTSCGSDGGGVVEVVVSTNILTLVSPVFKAMLAGPFRESIELAAAIRNGAANGPYTIDLPEDNADAMCLLMEAFHFRTTATTTNAPTPAMLETLAFLCDKYQCAKALNLTTAFWISAALQGLRGECLGTTPTGSSSATVKDGCLAKYMDGCWRLVVFAYVVDLPETFSQLCWEIIRHHVGPITDIPVTSRYSAKTGGSVQPVMVLNDHPLIRGCLATFLDGQQMRTALRLQQVLNEPFHWPWFSVRLTSSCHCGLKTLGYSGKVLTDLGLRPPTNSAVLATSLQTQFNQTQKFRDGVHVNNFARRCSAHGITCSGTHGAKYDIGRTMRAITAQVWAEASNACLDCFCTNSLSRKEETCRVKHQ